MSALRLAFLIACALLGVTAAAQPAAKNTSDAATRKQSSTAQAAITDVHVTPEQRSDSLLAGTDLARMLNRDGNGLLIKKNFHGGLFVDLRGGFRDVMVAQIGPDGKPVLTCIATEKAAERMMGHKDSAKQP